MHNAGFGKNVGGRTINKFRGIMMVKIVKSSYSHVLQNISSANLYKDLFPYDEIPKVTFNDIQVPMDLPKDIWITDTTLGMDNNQCHHILQNK